MARLDLTWPGLLAGARDPVRSASYAALYAALGEALVAERSAHERHPDTALAGWWGAVSVWTDTLLQEACSPEQQPRPGEDAAQWLHRIIQG